MLGEPLLSAICTTCGLTSRSHRIPIGTVINEYQGGSVEKVESEGEIWYNKKKVRKR